jgi:hypothetical protein
MSTTESIYISAQVAADRIGRSKRRVNQLVADGELESVRIGNMNVIQANSVTRYLNKRNGKAEPRRYCSGPDGCGVEITSTDVHAGYCTNCSRVLKG